MTLEAALVLELIVRYAVTHGDTREMGRITIAEVQTT